ncbi:MAG: small ribosomal subunit Rsm22 family protein [Alphaproteobacteria bacterium]|nr:small ribosomal subunit Rsm22 family protein [Alphaproteobacteria bacterium]
MTDTVLSACLGYLSQHSAFSLKDLKTARNQLWDRYQTTGEAGFRSDVERVAYILARFPSTYAACRDVFQRLPQDVELNSVLDLGCGPGTATLACLGRDIGASYILIENDAPMLLHCRGMVNLHTNRATFIQKNLMTESSYPNADLVMLSYVLGELSYDAQLSVLEKAFDAAEKYLVIISPGISMLFQNYHEWRQFLVKKGGTILAPCPLDGPCPMNPLSGRWCHFKARVNRTKELKYLKNATMSFEDEPYSYLIISKNAEKLTKASYRIIDHPQHRKGHSHFEVCTGENITTMTCSAKDPNYKHKKKLTWGDGLEGIY